MKRLSPAKSDELTPAESDELIGEVLQATVSGLWRAQAKRALDEIEKDHPVDDKHHPVLDMAREGVRVGATVEEIAIQAYRMGLVSAAGKAFGAGWRMRRRGRKSSIEKRQAAADERDRAAFYERWWEKRGKGLEAGTRPKISKERLAGDISASLSEGKRGSSEASVRRAINRWEKDLLAKRTGNLASP